MRAKFFQGGFAFNGQVAVAGVILIILGAVLIAVNPIKRYKLQKDEERIGQLEETQAILENFYNDYGFYPSSSSKYLIIDPKSDRSVEWGGKWVPYATFLPKDPERSKKFIYVSSPRDNYQSYTLYASFYYPLEVGATCLRNGENRCTRVPAGAMCGTDSICNAGVASPNSSP